MTFIGTMSVCLFFLKLFFFVFLKQKQREELNMNDGTNNKDKLTKKCINCSETTVSHTLPDM